MVVYSVTRSRVSLKICVEQEKAGVVNSSPASFLSPHFNSLLEVRDDMERERGRVKGRAGGKRDGESRSTRSSITTRSDRQCRAEWALLGSSS